jgi:hypothetical protein
MIHPLENTYTSSERLIPEVKQSHHCYGPLATSCRLNKSTAYEIAILVVAAAFTASIELPTLDRILIYPRIVLRRPKYTTGHSCVQLIL